MSRRFMVVWVAWVVLAVAYTVWIFESPDSQGASSPLMIVLMCILIAVPIVALFVGSRMVKKLFPPPPPRGTYRRDSVIDLEDGRGRFPTMDSVMESATSQSFFKAWDYWVQDNTTTATTIDDISHDDGADGHRDEEPCAICLSEYQVGEVSRRLPCGHSFHTCCFDNCFACRPRGFKLHHVCPLCRAALGPTLIELKRVREEEEEQESGDNDQQGQVDEPAPSPTAATTRAS
ncbi:hypothetical protein FOZ61_007146 [Perkinsus olseni]|uniref:RING-type domain-containing protein n=1 Tax=Perkinsus olseni TaxID=32597 RepID=A0A7J6LGR1_PEROL|nr:hypothetical protein FOZ61_007146 [Perkinsus olseni]KAF4658488.1 hypothetical protein FOL46_006945 [Perkinsus olseni]